MLHPHSHSHLSGVQTLAKSESKRRRRRREGREVFEVKAILGGFHIRRPKIFIFFDPLHPCTYSATYLCNLPYFVCFFFTPSSADADARTSYLEAPPRRRVGEGISSSSVVFATHSRHVSPPSTFLPSSLSQVLVAGLLEEKEEWGAREPCKSPRERCVS